MTSAAKLARKHNRSTTLRRRNVRAVVEQRWRTIYVTVRNVKTRTTLTEKTLRFIAKCVAHRAFDRIEAKYLANGFHA